VPDQLLSGIWDMGAQGGQEVECWEDAGRPGLRITAPLPLAAIVDDLAGFRAIAQRFQGNRRMDYVAGQALTPPHGRQDRCARLDRRRSPDASNSA